jgi:hypothetical protein
MVLGVSDRCMAALRALELERVAAVVSVSARG